MAYGKSDGLVTDDVTWPQKVKLVTQYAYSPISRTLRCYLATITNYQFVCCEAGTVGYRSDSLASCYKFSWLIFTAC